MGVAPQQAALCGLLLLLLCRLCHLAPPPASGVAPLRAPAPPAGSPYEGVGDLRVTSSSRNNQLQTSSSEDLPGADGNIDTVGEGEPTSQSIEESQVSLRQDVPPPVERDPPLHLTFLPSGGGGGGGVVPAPAAAAAVGTVQDELPTSAAYPRVTPGNGSPIAGSDEPPSSPRVPLDSSSVYAAGRPHTNTRRERTRSPPPTPVPTNIHTYETVPILTNSHHPYEQNVREYSQATSERETTTRRNVRRHETTPDITGTTRRQQQQQLLQPLLQLLLLGAPRPALHLPRGRATRDWTTSDRHSLTADDGPATADVGSLSRDGDSQDPANRRSLTTDGESQTTDRESLTTDESLPQSQLPPLSQAIVSATGRTNRGGARLNKAEPQPIKIDKQVNNTNIPVSETGRPLDEAGEVGNGAGGVQVGPLVLPPGPVTVGVGPGHTSSLLHPASRPGPRYADPLTPRALLPRPPRLPPLPNPHGPSPLTPQASLSRAPMSPPPQTDPMRQDSRLGSPQDGRDTQEPTTYPSMLAGGPQGSSGAQNITRSGPGTTHPGIDSILHSQTNSKSHQAHDLRQPYAPARPSPVAGGSDQMLSTSLYLRPRVNTGQRAELRQSIDGQRPDLRSPASSRPGSLKVGDAQVSSESVGSHHQGDGEGLQGRMTYTRQSASLNPLRIRPSSQDKPGALISTPLAYPEHRNFSYTNLTQESEPTTRRRRPTPGPLDHHAGGGPVDPAQLILHNSSARPAAPGRPPSNIIAQPSPVVPETLLVSPEPPSASLTVSKPGIKPSSPQVSGVPEVEELGPSPFFVGDPEQPTYVFTTPRPPSGPVHPADLLISWGAATRPPITVPPPGYNPLLDNLQRLDVIEANNDRDPAGVHIPAPQFPYPLPQHSNSYPSASNPVSLGQTRPGNSYLNSPEESSNPTFPGQHGFNSPRPPPDFIIPGFVATEPPSLRPVVVSNNTVLATQDIDPTTGLTDNRIAPATLAQIPDLITTSSDQQQSTNQTTKLETASAPSSSEELTNQNTGQSTKPIKTSGGILTTNSGAEVLPQQDLPSSTSTGSGFPPLPQNSRDPGHQEQRYPFIIPGISDPQDSLYYPQDLNGYPSTGYPQVTNYPLRPILQSLYPQSPYSQEPYPPYPGYINPYGNQFGPSGQYPPLGLPFPSQALSSDERQGVSGMGSSASVATTVEDQGSSATSEAEGGDGVVSSSTTTINGGTSTSNNNFYRPPPPPRPAIRPSTGSFQPHGLFRPPLLTGVRRPRPRPQIIVDGVLNTTAVLSDVFPGPNVSVACSRRHGCPTFILRTRPRDQPPQDNRRNTYIYDEALGTRPTGNVNIACDFQQGCPTYIINTTPTPQQDSPSTPTPQQDSPSTPTPQQDSPSTPTPQQDSPSTPTPPAEQHQLGTLLPSPQAAAAAGAVGTASSIDNQDLLNAISLVLGLLNQTEDFNIQNDEENLTGDFDSNFQDEGVYGYGRPIAHTPGSAPPIDPQNIRPGLQFVPSNAPYTTPLAQHIGLQNRPNYKVVRVPGNTVLSPATFSDLLDNKQSFQVNPILTSEPGGTLDTTQTFLGQPGTHDLLKNQLFQAHLDSLQEHGLGVTPSSPLRGHNLEEGSLDDAHMGQAVVTQPPQPLAAVLNLERQDIPDEPPLVPSDGQEEDDDDDNDHHHSTMMRQVMAAAFVGLPMTTALLGALGAPVAIMAPLGLAIPALLTMGFMDVNANSASHFRRHAHNRHHRHQPVHTSADSDYDNDENENDDLKREDDDTTTNDQDGDTRNSRRGQGSGQSRRPSSPDGGGIAGAIRRTLGLLPMLASRLTSSMGLRRRRRTADRGRTADYEDVSAPATRSPAGASAAAQPSPFSEQVEEDVVVVVPPAAPTFLQQDLATLENMTQYYSILRRAANNDSLKVAMPTPEEIELHRKYLLKLLKQLTKDFQRLRSSAGGIASLPQGSVLTNSQEELLSPPSVVVADPALQHEPFGPSEYSPGTSEAGPLVYSRGSNPPDGSGTLNDNSGSSDPHLDGHNNNNNAGPAISGVAVNRIGQVPPDYADPQLSQYADPQISQYADPQISQYADPQISQFANRPTSQYADLQNLDLDTAALIIHQLQTQGSVNLLPPNYLGQAPLAKPSTQRYDIVFGAQQAVDSLAHTNVGPGGGGGGGLPGASLPPDADSHPPVHRLASLDAVVIPPSFPDFSPASRLQYLPITSSSPRDFPRVLAKQSPHPDRNDTFPERPQSPSATEDPLDLLLRHPPKDEGRPQQLPPSDDLSTPAGHGSLNDHHNLFPSTSSLGGPYNLGMRYALPSSFSYPFEEDPAPPAPFPPKTGPEDPAPTSSFLPMTSPQPIDDSSPDHTTTISSFTVNENAVPVDLLQSPALLAKYEAMIKALQIVREVNRLRQSSVTLDRRVVVDDTTRVANTHLQTPPAFNTTPDLYFLNDAAEGATELAPKITTAITSLFASIGRAISNFFQSIAEAISAFFDDLATAIEETPAILLLGLVPLFFVLLSLFLTSGKSFGFSHQHFAGHGGGYGSGRLSPTLLHLDVDAAEALARFVLSHIDAFEERVTSSDFPP